MRGALKVSHALPINNGISSDMAEWGKWPASRKTVNVTSDRMDGIHYE